MPPLNRWFIKSALIYLALALAAGLLMAAQAAFQLPFSVPALRPVYLHLFIVGWITQLIFGVAYWMFPKFSKAQPHRSDALGRAVYVMINGGLILRVIGEPLLGRVPQIGWLLVISATLQMAAGWAFVVNSWGRVKGR